jgi:phosphoribosylaminoimidazolecarboxamide formyltransferase/IMP cyclohydrolase
MPKIERAILSLTDKSGAVEFARGLAGLGVELISTGGTARLLREAGLGVKDVAEVTGFPEMLDGRVKTIHPRIAAGVLAVRGKAEHMRALAEHGIPAIDMVVVNLYAFEKAAAKAGATVEDLIENIDIGGPTMIRAAAKNYQDVAVVVSPDDYAALLEEMRGAGGELSLKTRWGLARKAYALTAAYDRAITARLARIEVEDGAFRDQPEPALPETLDIRAPRALALRYGENPHQSAALYRAAGHGVAGGEQLHGKELSYNNLVDLDAAWQLALEFDAPAAAIIKHTNPCGCAEAGTPAEAYRRAYECDPVSAYGGVLAFNREVDEETAREIAKTFVEAIVAPEFSSGARAVLGAKKNLRLLKVTPAPAADPVGKSISGGFLVQTADTLKLDRGATQVKTQRAPTAEEWAALEFGWKVVKHVKSNAIVYARAGQTAGVGAGQMSRVDSVKFGAMKAVLPLAGTVVASSGTTIRPLARTIDLRIPEPCSPVVTTT